MVRLRLATLDDVGLLERWDADPVVMACTGDDEIHWPTEIDEMVPGVQETFIAEIDERPIGVVQVIDPAEEPTHYWGDIGPGLRAIDIWIGAADDRNAGHGTEMMRLALARCFAPDDVTAVIIDPLVGNTDAHRFYRRFGFVATGEQRFGNDVCLLHRLDRGSWPAAER